ncbi:hypothetical protein [Luteimonas viscosa]|nr:hypothetical protein [Luteimonas viscosa]
MPLAHGRPLLRACSGGGQGRGGLTVASGLVAAATATGHQCQQRRGEDRI